MVHLVQGIDTVFINSVIYKYFSLASDFLMALSVVTKVGAILNYLIYTAKRKYGVTVLLSSFHLSGHTLRLS